jgi:multidrug efflux pump subunit AcrB
MAIDRQALGDLGLSAAQVASGVRSAVDGDLAARYRDGEKDYDIRVLLRPEDRSEKALLERLTFPSKKGRLVMLREVARVEGSTSPATIERLNRQRRAVISGNLDGRSLGQVVNELTPRLEAMHMPDGYSFELTGQTKNMRETMGNMMLALLLAIVFIYLVLASQFESFVHPFTIMLSLPLAVVGALLALFLTGKALGLFSMIGIILLMGLVTKNAILLIDCTNQLREQGMGMKEALLVAGPTRLRPILMTSAAMILGMLPAAISNASGSEMRAPMAISVIAGVLTSTVLTLVVVPVAYTWIDRFTIKRKAKPESELGPDEQQPPAEGSLAAR